MSRYTFSKIQVKSGEAIELSGNDVVVVVGPNNGGKSTFLRELVDHIRAPRIDKLWLQSAVFHTGNAEDFFQLAKSAAERSRVNENGETEYIIPDSGTHLTASQYKAYFDNHLHYFWPLYFKELTALQRIELSNAVGSIDTSNGQGPAHPMHYLLHDEEGEAAFSEEIEGAFGKQFRLRRLGSTVGGLIGISPSEVGKSFVEYENAKTDQMVPIERVGDGLRAFAGILLHLQSRAKPVTTIDEPEAFLHPPQAYRLGRNFIRAIGEDQQLFIATHSSDLLGGILSETKGRVKILYLNHEDKESPFVAVSAGTIKAISSDPVFMHSNLVDSLFYSRTVVCEGNADIQILTYLISRFGNSDPRECFWFSNGGKFAIPKIVENLLPLGVKPVCVFDIDVILNPEILISIAELYGADISSEMKAVATAVSSLKVSPAEEVLERIEDVLASEISKNDPERAVRQVKQEAERMRKSWTLKHSGIEAFHTGQDYRAVQTLIEKMAEIGVLILRQGEVESYVKAEGAHGARWVANVVGKEGKYDDQLKPLYSELSHVLRLDSE